MTNDTDIPRTLVERAIQELSTMDGVLLTDPQGKVLVTVGSAAANDAKVLSLASGLLQLAERATDDLGRGQLDHIVLRGDLGHLVAKRLKNDYGLIILGGYETRLGLLLHDMELLAGKLESEVTSDE